MEVLSTKRKIKSLTKEDGAGEVVYHDHGKIYCNEGEGHAGIVGTSGCGKTRGVIVPLAIQCLKAKESILVIDSKDRSIEKNIKQYIPKDYDAYYLDLIDKNGGVNILRKPYEDFKTNDPERMDRAKAEIDEIADSIFPIVNYDPFWSDSAKSVFNAITRALFLVGKPEEINFNSITNMIIDGDNKYGAGSTFLKEFDKLLNDDYVSKQLSSYISAPNETKGGMHSTYLTDLSKFCRYEGLSKFLSSDYLKIDQLKGDKPTIIFFRIPDYSNIYNSVAGVIISQIMRHYVHLADDKFDGKLPIKLNFVLDEFGNIGKALGNNFDFYLTASRSRNIRVHYVLQSYAQLYNIWGEEKAKTILDNTDVKIIFRTNHLATLKDISELCGEKTIIKDGRLLNVPLLSPCDLNALKLRQALIIMPGAKFVTVLPDFTDIYGQPQSNVKSICEEKRKEQPEKVDSFDILEFVKKAKREQARFYELNNKAREKEEQAKKRSNMASRIPTIEEFMAEQEKQRNAEKSKLPEHIMEDLAARLEKKLAEIEEQERIEAELKANQNKGTTKKNDDLSDH